MHQRLPYPPIKTAVIVGIQIGNGVLVDGKTREEVSTVLKDMTSDSTRDQASSS